MKRREISSRLGSRKKSSSQVEIYRKYWRYFFDLQGLMISSRNSCTMYIFLICQSFYSWNIVETMAIVFFDFTIFARFVRTINLTEAIIEWSTFIWTRLLRVIESNYWETGAWSESICWYCSLVIFMYKRVGHGWTETLTIVHQVAKLWSGQLEKFR